jgi:5,10-methylene-tetrahydrofolate dehydrogenase/methenyl tetrahydrofolate cyclohydrolase
VTTARELSGRPLAAQIRADAAADAARLADDPEGHVTGGVGPVTTALLLRHVTEAAALLS